MNKKITKLTPEQKAVIPEYFKKWKPFVFSCEAWDNINKLRIIDRRAIQYCEADFCISVLKCNVDRQKWNLSKLLLKHCGSFFLYEKVCLICDRPRLVLLDSHGRFHAEGTPAIEFRDGFSIYAYRHIRLPTKYGRFHPSSF